MNAKLTPAVFVVNREYHIMMYVEKTCLMWVQVGDKKYYDEANGIMRSDTMVHKAIVPMEELDAVGVYTVCLRKVIERKPYFPEIEETKEYTYTFRPVTSSGTVRAYHIADAHNWVDGPVAAAKVYGDIDFLILNGDIPDHSGTIENCITIYEIASELTGGTIPIVFARGNHDMRGLLAERFCELTPTDNGRTYYTFRLGKVWGLILDCGEDKVDENAEYGGTICCHDFRERQTAFIQNVVAHAYEQYEEEGVEYRIVIAHNPFTVRHEVPFDIERKIYMDWARLIGENIRPNVMISGHMHCLDIVKSGDEKDLFGQQFPVVIGSDIKANHKYYAGTGILLTGTDTVVTFTDCLGKVVREELLRV